MHCHHCGKEVELGSGADRGGEITPSASVTPPCDASLSPEIVQPPEGFADSPDQLRSTKSSPRAPSYATTSKTSSIHSGVSTLPRSGGRLFRKLEKRYRSEERGGHGTARGRSLGQEIRAKVYFGYIV